MANPFFGGEFFNGGFFGLLNQGDWQVFYHDRHKRWRKELLDREALRNIIRKAVVGNAPVVAEYVEPVVPVRTPDTSRVKQALARAMPVIAYDEILADIPAIQRILSWYYRRPVEVTREDDDDDAVMVLML